MTEEQCWIEKGTFGRSENLPAPIHSHGCVKGKTGEEAVPENPSNKSFNVNVMMDFIHSMKLVETVWEINIP